MTYEVSDSEITQGREDLADLLWERCTIRRRSTPVVGTFATIATNVPCRLAPRGGEVGGNIVLAVADPHGEFSLSLGIEEGQDPDEVMKPGDRATVTSRLLVGTRVFEARYVEPRVAFLMRVRGSVEG